MASPTSRNVSGGRSDLYELERLAEELAARELSGTSGGEHSAIRSRACQYMFRCLMTTNFWPLRQLRTELREYLACLKEELVLLINDDYEDFISLSTDLRGEGVRLGRLKAPLSSLREQMQASRQSLQSIQNAIQAKLDARSKLREEKALLHLLLKISESVTRLESLLLISQTNVPNHVEMPPSHLSGLPDLNSGVKTRGSRGKHLSRVATEYTQLLYHVSKARAENCAYVEEIRWSIDRIRDNLTSDLDHLFSVTLLALTETGDGKVSELERAKVVTDLTECLRVYDVLGLWRVAEDIINRNVVQPFVRKTIHPDALAAPHSPIIPHTPIPPLSGRVASRALPPRTPYTPYTAFSSKQNSFDAKYETASSSIPFLDESEDALAKLFNQILRFVARDLGRILEIAEHVSVKSTPARLDPTSIAASPSRFEAEIHAREGFDIMANVIWPAIGQAIMDELGFVVFAAGKPDEFLKRHATTQAFIRALEFIAPSIESVQAMRSHPVFVAFNRRWQLPIYFQLRWKDIVGKLEDCLTAVTLNPDSINSDPGQSAFLTPQAENIWASIGSCWSAEVFIPDLAYRFWRLTLQLLSRYKTWLEASLPLTEPPTKPTLSTDKPRSSTSQAVSEPAPENSAADDLLLKQYAVALVDINVMTSQITALWREEISLVLPEFTMDQDIYTDPEAALQEQLDSLGSIAVHLTKQIASLLARWACDALLPVRAIPSQFRAMSSKRVPTEASYFVPLILRPVKAFFGVGGPSVAGDRLRDSLLKESATEVFDSVCQRYIQYLTAMKKTEESLRRLKKGKKSTLGIFGSASTSKDDDRDEERIRTQMIIDVGVFGEDGKSLGVDVPLVESYVQLTHMVHNEFVDDNNQE
ncbi:oligomeric golgi complex component, COG2-domain-containing protein [Melanogaster broomeanus]|nr:oligomeric golgi complex component, COG2-domain-containing protein [Melanogaster broomeanus]